MSKDSAGTLRLGGTTAMISVLGLTSQQIASFVITLLAAGFLSAADYGIYTLAIVFVEFVVMLTYTGYFHFVVNSDAEETTLISTMFWIMIGIGAVGGGLLVIFAGAIAAFFDAPALAPVLRLFGLMQPFASAIGWASALLTRAGLMRRYFLILIASNLGGMVAGCVVLALWQSLYALVIYRAIRIALGLVMFGLAVPAWPRLRFDRAQAWQATRYSAGLYGSRFLNFFSTFGTDLILAYIFSTAEAGLYRFANRLAMASVDIVAQPLRSFALKRFGEAARSKRPLEEEMARFLSAQVFLSGAVAVMLIVLGHTVVETLFHPDYLAAVGALQALALRAWGLSGANMIEPVFAAHGRTRISMYFNLVWTTAMIAAILVFSPMGYVALASSQAAVTVASSVAAIYTVRRFAGVPVGPAVRRASLAVAMLTVYGVVLAMVWAALSEAMAPGALLMAVGIAVALALGLMLAAVAERVKVLDLRIFVE